jgi:lysophospholipid acyltransferase (LPLAT)-like uncharacterized protein
MQQMLPNDVNATPSVRLTRGQRLLIAVAPIIVRLLYGTWRIRVVNSEGWRTLRVRKAPVLFTLWHGQMLPLLVQHRREGVSVLISEHRDGELIAKIAQRFGFRAIRGSTSRGALRALAAIARVIEDGGDVAITPDGPRGPAYSFAPGALIAAQRTAAPIVGVGVHASRAWRLKSWDAFMIPQPFARVAIVYTDPVFVKTEDARSAAQQGDRFLSLMNDAAARAQLAWQQ